MYNRQKIFSAACITRLNKGTTCIYLYNILYIYYYFCHFCDVYKELIVLAMIMKWIMDSIREDKI